MRVTCVPCYLFAYRSLPHFPRTDAALFIYIRTCIPPLSRFFFFPTIGAASGAHLRVATCVLQSTVLCMGAWRGYTTSYGACVCAGDRFLFHGVCVGDRLCALSVFFQYARIASAYMYSLSLSLSSSQLILIHLKPPYITSHKLNTQRNLSHVRTRNLVAIHQPSSSARPHPTFQPPSVSHLSPCANFIAPTHSRIVTHPTCLLPHAQIPIHSLSHSPII